MPVASRASSPAPKRNTIRQDGVSFWNVAGRLEHAASVSYTHLVAFQCVARQIHKTLPVATAALGRTLAAASMMGNALKSDGASLTLQFKGGGPLGTVLAVSDNEGNVRGYVTNPHVEMCIRDRASGDQAGARTLDLQRDRLAF